MPATEKLQHVMQLLLDAYVDDLKQLQLDINSLIVRVSSLESCFLEVVEAW